ncbi:hypothetical protein LCGC14_3039070, partial [marine sediment metagenome]
YLADKVESGELVLPAGVSYTFAGSYENQVRSQKTLLLVLPLALGMILLILYFQFRALSTTALVFGGIFIAWAGGFILLWMYGQDWFMDFSVFGVSMRGLFDVHPINLSVAVWVGFLALFGMGLDREQGASVPNAASNNFPKRGTFAWLKAMTKRTEQRTNYAVDQEGW